MYWYKIFNRDKSKCFGGVAADSPKQAIERWRKAGLSKWCLLTAEVYGYSDKTKRAIEVYGS